MCRGAGRHHRGLTGAHRGKGRARRRQARRELDASPPPSRRCRPTRRALAAAQQALSEDAGAGGEPEHDVHVAPRRRQVISRGQTRLQLERPARPALLRDDHPVSRPLPRGERRPRRRPSCSRTSSPSASAAASPRATTSPRRPRPPWRRGSARSACPRPASSRSATSSSSRARSRSTPCRRLDGASATAGTRGAHRHLDDP